MYIEYYFPKLSKHIPVSKKKIDFTSVFIVGRGRKRFEFLFKRKVRFMHKSYRCLFLINFYSFIVKKFFILSLTKVRARMKRLINFEYFSVFLSWEKKYLSIWKSIAEYIIKLEV